MDHHDIPPGLAGIMGVSGFSTPGDSKNHMDHLMTGGGGSWSLGGLGRFGVGADGMGGFGGGFHAMHGYTRYLKCFIHFLLSRKTLKRHCCLIPEFHCGK